LLAVTLLLPAASRAAPFPLSGYTIPPWLFGVRAIISLLVFALCVHVGYLRRPAATG
jgi:hypothetical protein